MTDYPNLGKTQPFGKDPNDGRLGKGRFIFTRSSLGRIVAVAFTCTAALTGVKYILNAIDNNFGIQNNNNKNNDKNGK